MDQLVLSLIYTTLSESIMAQIVGLKTSFQVWTALQNIYTNRSKARELQLRQELQSCQKGSSSISEFLQRFKEICDALEAINQPVINDDKVMWLLKGLGTDYQMFSTEMLCRPPIPTYDEVVSHLIGQEFLFNSFTSSTPADAFQVQRGGFPNQGARGGRGDSPRVSFRGGHSYNNRGRGTHFYNSANRGGHYYNNGGRGASISPSNFHPHSFRG